MACFGRTAQPRVGQAIAGDGRLAALALSLATILAASTVDAQKLPQKSPARPETATAAESTTPAESSPARRVKPPPGVAPGPALRDLVTVEPGATCLERERLIDRVVRWLQRTHVEAALRVHVRGDSELATRVFFAVVRDPGDAAERRLDNAPSDCDQLHSAVALSIALAIEATLQHPGAGGEIPDEPSPAAGWKRKAPSRPMHLDLAVLGGATVGVLTGASLAGSPRLALSPWPWFEIAVAGLATHLSGETVEGVPGTFESTLLAGGLDACFGGETTQGAAFFMCIGGRAGSFRTRGHDFNMGNDKVTDWWAALALSGQGRFWLSGPFGVGTSVEALYALRQRRLVVRGFRAEDRGREVPDLGLTVTIGPVFRFF
jgi:hypothetical protein